MGGRLTGAWWAGGLTVAATFVHFLLFAQYGFLRLVEQRLGADASAHGPMLAMGVAGLAASLATGWLLRSIPASRWIRPALIGSAATTVLSLACRTPAAFAAAAALVGASTGVLTVAVASDLRGLLRSRAFGLEAGLATGAAYFVCNLPALFEGRPGAQAGAAAALCLGAAAALSLRGGVSRPPKVGVVLEAPPAPAAFAAAVLTFLALIWIDSAAFAIIQETPELKAVTWEGARTWVQGALHLAAAIVAGTAIDRGWLARLPPVAFVLFMLAFGLLPGGAPAWSGPIYAIGISFYSVALVAYPSWQREEPGSLPRRWRAAVLFGVAGWLGSALGVGMAEDLHRIPASFLAAAGASLIVAWAAERCPRVRAIARQVSPALTFAAVGGAAAALLAPAARVTEPAATAIERGRRVYVEEGCIHCHSQFVRSATADEVLWGPFRAVDRERESPPLLGNRRQGPDLRNAGNRRSAVWHRLHLAEPRRLSPGSRMPSYAHLFEGGGRGDDLVEYLASLGGASAAERFLAGLATPVERPPREPSAVRGARLFREYCAVCHGPGGRGDGPLAPAMWRPAMDLAKDDFWLVSWEQGVTLLEEGLARLIRFGVPGTSMPGHETLGDQEVADLAAFVAGLPGSRPWVPPRGWTSLAEAAVE